MVTAFMLFLINSDLRFASGDDFEEKEVLDGH